MARHGMSGKPLSFLQQKVFDHLVHVAEAGEPCPTNKEMQERFGIGSSGTAGVLCELVRKDAIRIERDECQHRRIVILASGAATAFGTRSGYAKDRHLLDVSSLGEAERRHRESEAYWLEQEQRKYGLPRRGKPLSEMAA